MKQEDSDQELVIPEFISCTPLTLRQLKGGDDVISKTPMFTDRHTLTISTPNLFRASKPYLTRLEQ